MSAAVDAGPTSDLDPFADEFLVDPFPALAELREVGPVVHLPRYDIWAVARHRDVNAVLRDHQRFSSAAGVGIGDLTTDAYSWRKPSLILEVDPPTHTAHRAILGGAMNPRAMRTFQEVFDTEAATLADRLVALGRFDAVTDLAEPFPSVVFPRALGADSDTREALLAYGSLSFNAIGPANRHLEAALERARGVPEWITENCRRDALRPGSIGTGIHDAAAAAGLSEDQAALLVRSLFSAGVDTTVSGLAFAVLAFARHPEQWQLVRDDPSLARGAFDEVIRHQSPVIGFFRTTTTDIEWGDVVIPAHRKVMVFFAGANRDPRHWDRPDAFDIRRRTAGNLGYGAGPHVCAGMTIARMEGEALIRALAARVESWQLDGDPEPRLNNSLRGLAHLPVQVRPR